MTDKKQITRVAAYGLVLRENQILLCRISDQLPRLAGQWTLPGGGIDFQENPIDAMIREVREETGLIVANNGLAGVDSNAIDAGDTDFHAIRIIYHTNILGGELTNEIDGTTDLCQWWALEDTKGIDLVDLAESGLNMLAAMANPQTQPYSIVSAGTASSHHLDQLRGWFESEWGHIDPFEGNHEGVKIPRPILALDAQERLAGGLAFSTANRPGAKDIAVWVNTLLVAPEHRRTGLASRLVQEAHVRAADLGVRKLYVLSDVPALYEKLAWRVIERTGADTILSKELAD